MKVDSNEAKTYAETCLKWLNMMANQIFPYVLKEIRSAEKLENGNIKLNVLLITDSFKGRDFEFNLELNPAIDNPTALVYFRQVD